MSEFSDEHLNVRPDAGTAYMTPVGGAVTFPTSGSAWSAFVEHANSNARGLQRAINAVHDMGGGYVYIPAGRYYVGRNRTPQGAGVPIYSGFALDVPDVLVYPDVTLSFAPGAVLVPMNFSLAGVASISMPGRPSENWRVRIEIQGDLDTEVRQIFDALLEVDMPEVASATPAGFILFTGTRIREVHPEWWGALAGALDAAPAVQPRIARINHAALQAAIDAAHTHRRRPLRDADRNVRRDPIDGKVLWWHLPTIPVLARSSYLVWSTLYVGVIDDAEAIENGLAEPLARPNLVHDPRARQGTDLDLDAPNPAPFVLRGERELQGRDTFLAANLVWQPTKAAPMLEIRGIASFVLRDVRFSGQRVAATLLRVEPSNEDGHCELSGCTFSSVREDMPLFSEERGDVSARSTPLANDAGAALIRLGRRPTTSPGRDSGRVNIAFTRCRLDTDLAQTLPPGVVTGYRTFAWQTRGVVIDLDDDVNLEFRCTWMTGVANPMIDAVRGHFALNEVTTHTLRAKHDRSYALKDGRGPFLNSSSGTDIFIERPRTISGVREAPASFTAREAESQSYQYLASFPGGPDQPSTPGPIPTGHRSACVLLNLHHVCVAGGAADDPDITGIPLNRPDHRPSIYWAGPGVLGSHLVAIGCRFAERYFPGTSDDSGPLGGIRLANNQSGEIYHLGNTTYQNPGTYQSTPDRCAPVGIILAQDPEAPLPATRIRTLPLR